MAELGSVETPIAALVAGRGQKTNADDESGANELFHVKPLDFATIWQSPLAYQDSGLQLHSRVVEQPCSPEKRPVQAASLVCCM